MPCLFFVYCKVYPYFIVVFSFSVHSVVVFVNTIAFLKLLQFFIYTVTYEDVKSRFE